VARILAIDYGLKRTGLAVSDIEGIIAMPLTTVRTIDLDVFLNNYIKKENIKTIVIGFPRRLNNMESHITSNVVNYINKLKKEYPEINIVSIDERFTSKMASIAILESGVNRKRRQDKSLVDKVSAAIILQSFLNKKS